MIPVKLMLNKIRWDINLNPEDYTILYKDFNHLKEIRFNDIKKLDGVWMSIEIDGMFVLIPTHRIKIIKCKNEVIWQRGGYENETRNI